MRNLAGSPSSPVPSTGSQTLVPLDQFRWMLRAPAPTRMDAVLRGVPEALGRCRPARRCECRSCATGARSFRVNDPLLLRSLTSLRAGRRYAGIALGHRRDARNDA